jgi:hypothetical protein
MRQHDSQKRFVRVHMSTSITFVWQITRACQECRLVQMPTTSTTLRNKRRATFALQRCQFLDPKGHFDPDKMRVVSRSSKRSRTSEASRQHPHSSTHSKPKCGHRHRSPGTLRIAQCHATNSREMLSSKIIARFALWLSVTRYDKKWADHCICNFPNWSPTVNYDAASS